MREIKRVGWRTGDAEGRTEGGGIRIWPFWKEEKVSMRRVGSFLVGKRALSSLDGGQAGQFRSSIRTRGKALDASRQTIQTRHDREAVPWYV